MCMWTNQKPPETQLVSFIIFNLHQFLSEFPSDAVGRGCPQKKVTKEVLGKAPQGCLHLIFIG